MERMKSKAGTIIMESENSQRQNEYIRYIFFHNRELKNTKKYRRIRSIKIQGQISTGQDTGEQNSRTRLNCNADIDSLR